MCKIEINGVNITLTKEQLEEIDKQRNEYFDYKQIQSYEDACKHLNNKPKSIEDYDNDLIEFTIHKLKKINKAINTFIKKENDNLWYPYFQLVAGGGLIYRDSYCYYGGYTSQVCCTYNEDSAEYLGTKFIDLYTILHKEY